MYESCRPAAQRRRIRGAPLSNQAGERSTLRQRGAGPPGDGEVRELGELPPALPLVEAQESVEPKNEAQGLVRMLAPQLDEGVHGTGGTGAPELARVHRERSDSGDRRAQHLEALRRRRYRGRAQSRSGRRKEQDGVQSEVVSHLRRKMQMATVHRVEGASEDPDGGHYAETLPSLT